MVHFVIWAALGFLIYVHFGYPAVLAIWKKLAARPVRKGFWEPTVSILIAAHNERKNIARKIENCLQLDYPSNKLQVVVILDCPTDGTETIAARYKSDNVRIVPLATHKGKAGALNYGVSAAKGEILVFADARQMFDRSALRELVANFNDPEVGSASGELILLDDEGNEAADALGLYWRYEKWMRCQEADIHSMMGATGAIYAIRHELYKQIPDDTILDDVAIPMNIVLSCKRAIFDSAARAYDHISVSPEAEYDRKVRTLMGNYQILSILPALLSPFHNPVWLQYMSHKVGRLMVPFVLAVLFVANLFALNGFYLWLFAAQCAWYLLAIAGGMLRQDAQPSDVSLQMKREGQ